MLHGAFENNLGKYLKISSMVPLILESHYLMGIRKLFNVMLKCQSYLKTCWGLNTNE